MNNTLIMNAYGLSSNPFNLDEVDHPYQFQKQQQKQQHSRYGSLMNIPSEFVGRFIGSRGKNIREFGANFPNNRIFIYQDVDHGDFLVCENKNGKAVSFKEVFEAAQVLINRFNKQANFNGRSHSHYPIHQLQKVPTTKDFPALSTTKIQKPIASCWLKVRKPKQKKPQTVDEPVSDEKNMEELEEYSKSVLSEEEWTRVFGEKKDIDIHILTEEEEEEYFRLWNEAASGDPKGKGWYIDIHRSRASFKEPGWYFTGEGYQWEGQYMVYPEYVY